MLDIQQLRKELPAVVAGLARRGVVFDEATFRGLEDHRKQLGGIVGFRLVAEQISMKFKLSQNHPEANIESVIEQLPMSNQHHAAVIAEMMREQLDKPKP